MTGTKKGGMKVLESWQKHKKSWTRGFGFLIFLNFTKVTLLRILFSWVTFLYFFYFRYFLNSYSHFGFSQNHFFWFKNYPNCPFSSISLPSLLLDSLSPFYASSSCVVFVITLMPCIAYPLPCRSHCQLPLHPERWGCKGYYQPSTPLELVLIALAWGRRGCKVIFYPLLYCRYMFCRIHHS